MKQLLRACGNATAMLLAATLAAFEKTPHVASNEAAPGGTAGGLNSEARPETSPLPSEVPCS